MFLVEYPKYLLTKLSFYLFGVIVIICLCLDPWMFHSSYLGSISCSSNTYCWFSVLFYSLVILSYFELLLFFSYLDSSALFLSFALFFVILLYFMHYFSHLYHCLHLNCCFRLYLIFVLVINPFNGRGSEINITFH